MQGNEKKAESGRAKVRRVLIEPLEDGGMSRKRGVSVADHERRMGKLADGLGYMSEHGLEAVRLYFIRWAGERNVWPEVNTVLSYAWRTETPPSERHEYVLSLMRSRAGEAAHDGSYVVELYSAALKYGPPPSRHQVFELRKRAEANRDRVQLIRDQIQRGVARDEDRDWLEGYHRLKAEAEAMVMEGKEERAAA